MAGIGDAVEVAVGSSCGDRARVGDSIAVAVGFAGIWNTVGIAIRSRAGNDVAEIGDTVVVAIRTAGVGIAVVGDAVAVAVGFEASTEFVRVRRTIEIAVLCAVDGEVVLTLLDDVAIDLGLLRSAERGVGEKNIVLSVS